MGCGLSIDPNPSSVVMSEPCTLNTGVTHERIAWPLTITVHAPHWPRPQPNFDPFNWRSSLRMYNSGVVGSTSTVCARPFTLRVITLIGPLYIFRHTSMKGPGSDGDMVACCFLRSATTSATQPVHVGTKSTTGRNS